MASKQRVLTAGDRVWWLCGAEGCSVGEHHGTVIVVPWQCDQMSERARELGLTTDGAPVGPSVGVLPDDRPGVVEFHPLSEVVVVLTPSVRAEPDRGFGVGLAVESGAEFTARVIGEARAKRDGQDAAARAVLTNRVLEAIRERLETHGPHSVVEDICAEAAVEVFADWLRIPAAVAGQTGSAIEAEKRRLLEAADVIRQRRQGLS